MCMSPRWSTRPAGSATSHRSRPATRDAELLVEIRRVFNDRRRGRRLYGARKVWSQLRREEIDVARCTVERLMRADGLVGARRDIRLKATRPDPSATRPADLVKRDFRANRPNELWVVDFTYVPTWSGTVFTAFVTDVFSPGGSSGGAPPHRCPPSCLSTPSRWRVDS